MSAFMVSDEHIDMMVTAGLIYRPQHSPFSWYFADERRYLTPTTAQATGLMLLKANRDSINVRYNEYEPVEDYTFNRLPVSPSPVEALKGINCFEYQACEVPDWDKTEAYAFCEALTKAIIGQLPGYEDAPWEWSTGGRVTQ